MRDPVYCSQLINLTHSRYEATACEDFAKMVKEKLDFHKNNDQLGPNSEKSKSTLLILDRKFDIVSFPCTDRHSDELTPYNFPDI